MLDQSFLMFVHFKRGIRNTCTSNHEQKLPSLNPGKGCWWMGNINGILCIIYMSLATWTKVCFPVPW